MMIRKLLAGATFALIVLLAGPQEADAQFWSDYVCAEASYNPCVDFEMFDNGGGNYSFIVTYDGSDGDPVGMLTAAGLYDYNGDGSPFSFENVVFSASGGEWTVGDDDDCEQLSGGGNVYFKGCAATDGGIKQGVGEGGWIQFDFDLFRDNTLSSLTLDDFAENGGEIGARAMIQGVGEEDCSYKLDSPQGLISGCGTEVPEPMSLLLMATGLVGVGAVGYRRREEEDV